ncbi:hypothetical protein DR864_09010 [Runella rosea]|uniref:Uncharacterized protein n=1 Tax=Runella rosea TaxID=2259595 RepID=A0A344TGU1_9BACT|nr:hypothetical protein [Runella rosea]AXE17862.1 hypothetical protein DR864_09010 [Runella rosea]
MIQQTYYPFSGEVSSSPISSSTLISGISPALDNPMPRLESESNWVSWILLIITLIGLAGVVYWWKLKQEN